MDIHQRAKERYNQARDAFAETRNRMVEDLRFSNPAKPEQWDERVRKMRENSADGARPCLTFDQTNQYIAQVVNDSRQNKPSIKVMPVDSGADPDVAERLEGIIRHIEYASRAGIAYDTAQEYAARIGLGWLRVLPEVVDPEQNLQEIRIKRVHDPLSALIDNESTEPDGSDAMWGHIETRLQKSVFEKRYKGKKVESWDSNGWFDKDGVRICEYFEITETDKNMLVIRGPEGDEMRLSEEDYWALAQQIGFNPEVISTYTGKARSQKWVTMSGCEILEETDFPSKWIPIVPVLGYEIWIEGKRYLCGLTRRMMDAQRAYNYERSSYIETVALQPKAPFLTAWESIENFEGEWASANVGNKAYLPYNAFDENGQALPTPSRQSPPAVGAAFIQGQQMALSDLQASVGMYRANLGAPSNETSGRAINARKMEGDTANFHYIDNLSRSMEHLGRIVVDMIPKIYDTKRIAKILGDDGSNDQVTIDPQQPQAAVKQGKKVVVINPNVGTYDVRVKVGPSYTTLREEAALNLSEILKGNPNLVPILGPMWAKMQDWPEAEKVSRMLLAMAPPQVQEIEQGNTDIPPAVQAQMQQMQQQIQQLSEALQNAAQEVDETRSKEAAEQRKLDIEAYKAETERMTAVAPAMTPEEVQALVMQTLQQVLSAPPLQEAPPMQSPPPQDMQPEQMQIEPAQAGFFTPEENQQ